MTHINVCFLGDDSSAKTLVGNLLYHYNKDIDFDIKNNDYEKIISSLESERIEMSNKSALIWSFIIKNKQFNVSFVNKDNGIDRSFFNTASSCDIGFVVFDLNNYTNKVSTLLKHKLFIMNVLGIKNILVFLDNVEKHNLTEVQLQLTNMLKKRNYKETKIFFFTLEKTCIPSHDNFIKVLSSIRLVNKSKDKLILPISNVFKLNDKYLGINGRLLSGTINVNDFIIVNPNLLTFKVLELQTNHININSACAGDNIGLRLEYNEDITEGMIITNMDNPFKKITNITCQFIVMNKNRIPKDLECIFYCNSIKVNCIIKTIFKTIDKKNKTLKKKPDELDNGDNSIINIELRHPISILPYKTNNKLGSFVLMDKEDTDNILGVGLVKSIKT